MSEVGRKEEFMDKITKVLMGLIRNVVCEDKMDWQDLAGLSDAELDQLFEIGQKHSIGPILGEALGRSENFAESSEINKFKQTAFLSVYRYEQLQADINDITEVLEAEKIPYIKLKGPRVRKYYPQPWLRTSCDIDILIHEEDIENTVKALVEKLAFLKKGRNYHDVLLVSSRGICLELHFSIKENMENLDRVLSKVWEYSEPVNVSSASVEWQQTNEFFLFHLLAHMAYHFQHGGCGIRSAIDIYLIRNKMQYDEEKVKELCRQAGIDTFYEYVIQLTEVWFGQKEHTEVTLQMENFILHGGTYGTKENGIAAGQNVQGGHFGYIWNRIFMSYDALSMRYPELKNRKFLTPVYQVRRWISMIKDGKLKGYTKEFEMSRHMDESKVQSVSQMLKELKLDS